MKRAKWLGILVVMVLVMSLVGTVASADTTIKMDPQKIELEDFLESNIRVDKWGWVEIDELVKGGTYIIEFTPWYRLETGVVGVETYILETWINYVLGVTPKDNDCYVNGEKVTLNVSVLLRAYFDNLEDLVEFHKELLQADKGGKKVSVEVELLDNYRYYTKEELESWSGPRFEVCFRKK